jgi:hypothetical protein
MKTQLLGFSAICITIVISGCADSGKQTLPTYQVPQGYQAVPIYKYPPPTANPSSTMPAASMTAATAAVRGETQPGGATNPAAPAQAAPAQQPEVIPSSPGPDYVWMPSYWTMGLNGSWVWVGGHYVLRQGAAEEQLRAARGMLEQSRAGLTGKPLKNVDKALDQINSALQAR